MQSNTKPDLIIKLTAEQLTEAAELIVKAETESGMILGSLSARSGAIGLSYLPVDISQQIIGFANQKTDEGILTKKEEE